MEINGKEIYLISVNTLKQKSLINRNVDDIYVVNAIKAAQDIYLVEVLGLELVKKLCSMVANNNTHIPTDYATLLNNYVSDYLTFKVLSEIQVNLWQHTRNEGIMTNTNTESQPLGRNDITYIREYYNDLANGLVKRMQEYLCNANIKEYKRCATDVQYTTHICL